jgi:D-alanyl-D-alanine carboxypeptidase
VTRAPEAQAPPPAPPEAQEKGPRIEIARVRPVLVGRPPAAPEAGQPAPWQPSSIDDVLARFAADPSAPQASPPQWTAASADQRPSPPNAAIRGGAPLVFDPVEVRGAAPSTLDAQAANLARGSEAAVAPAPPVPAPAAAPAAFAEGAFQIQIGAYHSAAEAERQLAAVRGRAGELLIRHKPLTQEVRQGGKVLYRARYAGFEARAAASACSTLKRLKIDCLVMRAE